jgi:ABC-2 type transport system ATP-binding protein
MNTQLKEAPRSLATRMQEPPPAELMSVTKTYGDVVALHDLSFSVSPGELVTLLGANGAGKTTAVRLLLGLSAPARGLARVFGNDPRETKMRTRTGAMLQVARVPETLKVREHIDLFSSYYPDPLPRAAVIEAAALHGLESRLFGELSGGQKQRVLFALSICGNPHLLVLDEPTVGLDVEARRAMWEQIVRFKKRGCAILLTTHYLAEADAVADRIIVVDKGTVIANGTPSEIKQRAAGKKVRCITRIPLGELEVMRGVASVRAEDTSVEITTSDSDAVVRELFARDPSVSDLEVVAAGLEEAFLALKGAAS